MNLTLGDGLTRHQAWTHDHITRCGCCGSWTVITESDADAIADERYVWPVICQHLTPNRKAVA